MLNQRLNSSFPHKFFQGTQRDDWNFHGYFVIQHFLLAMVLLVLATCVQKACTWNPTYNNIPIVNKLLLNSC